ncbi:MAG: hypothetical protein ACKV2V_16535, partial [Blastocatellia bacterium]
MFRILSRNILIIIILACCAVPALAQADKLLGSWEGKMESMRGEQPISVVFKKEGDAITGTMPGMRPGTEMKMTDVKVDGSQVTAKANVETPNGALVINYKFMLEGDNLNGQGSLDFNGTPVTMDIKLKRAAAGAAARSGAGAPAQAAAGARPA